MGPTTGHRRRGRLPSVRSTSAVCIALGVLGLLGSLVDAAPADATTSAGLEQQANEIASSLSQSESRLVVIGERYIAERERYTTDLADERATSAAIVTIRGKIASSRRSLYQDALAAYVAGNDSGIELVMSGDAAEVSSGEAYLHVASDALSQAATLFSDAELARTTALGEERRDASAAAQALAQAGAARSNALSTAASERGLLSSVRGQLRTLVETEEAQAAAAAAAARAAAAAKAAKRDGASASPTAGPPSASTVTISTSPIPPGSIAKAFAGIRQCESGGNYAADTGNGYYGAYQFAASTWWGLGESGLPNEASPTTQDAAAYRLYQASGFAPWPECSALLGL